MKHSVLLDVVMKRTSTRNFTDRKLSQETAKKILTAGIRAPSAGNIQPRTFILINEQTVKDKLYALCEDQKFMQAAPLWIVICLDIDRHLYATKVTGANYDYTGILPFTFGVLDAALSLENMVIAAEALGLGSVIIGSVIEHPAEVKKILRLPEHCLALSILCIGYPKKRFEPREKWAYGAVVSSNGYRSIGKQDVVDYWRRVITSDLRRSGRKLPSKKIEKYLEERSYGKAYSAHYTQEFVDDTNKKLNDYLTREKILKD